MNFMQRRATRKFAEVHPSIGSISSEYYSKNRLLDIKVFPNTKKYVRKMEVTVRDYRLQDHILKLKKKNGFFLLTLDVDFSKEYSFSFYLIGRDGKYSREDKTLSDLRKITKIYELEEQPNVVTQINDKPEKVKKNSVKEPVKSGTVERVFVPEKRSWPTSSQYAQSLQNPTFSISKTYSDFSMIKFLRNENVKYSSIIQGAGNFGVVFKYVKENKSSALKCFTRGSPNIQKRFYEISKQIEQNQIEYLVKLKFYPDLVRVVNKPKEFFPALTMDWLEGKTLNTFIVENLKNSNSLRTVAQSLGDSLISMQSKGIAHGDLSSDNIIVDSGGTVHLIDYDGMYVPALKELGSEELGHESFQHPKRGRYYGDKLDNFSFLVIYTSLLAVAKSPKYWAFNGNDQDKALFDINDFLEPSKSKLMKTLKSENGKLKRLESTMEEFLGRGPDWDGFDPLKIIKLK